MMLPDTPSSPADTGAMGHEPGPPEFTGPISLTMTFFADGRVQVSDPVSAGEATGPPPGGPAVGEGGAMNTMTDETAGDPDEAEGGAMFPSLDHAVRHVVRVAQAVGAAPSEQEGLAEGFGHDAGAEPDPAGGY